MAIGSRGIIERRQRALTTRHRPARPAATSDQIEALASVVSSSDVASHVAEADPHTGYQREGEKDQANGYLGADANARLTSSKVQVSATDRVLGRFAGGAGAAEELEISDFMQGVLNDADAAAVRASIAAQSTAAGAWSAASLQNSWVDYGAPYGGAEYMKDNEGMVHVRGLIKDGTTVANTLLFTLPAGYRPAVQEIIVLISNGAICAVNVETDGEVRLAVAASASWLTLNMHFST